MFLGTFLFSCGYGRRVTVSGDAAVFTKKSLRCLDLHIIEEFVEWCC